jgi:tripartite-type tricarboxylate transporter receptor subunit TctC
MERIKQQAGVTPAITTFEGGGDMMINVLNHTLDVGVGELQEIRAQLDAGRLRLLAVAGDERLPQLPDLPTLREQGLVVSVRKFRGLAGPKGTPPEVIARLESAIPRLLEDPAYRKHYLANGLLPGFIPHADYVRFIERFGYEAAGFLKESGVIR